MDLKDHVVGYTDESGVQIPPLHPRCRCVIEYREVAAIEFNPQRFGEPENIRASLQKAMAQNKIKGELMYPPPTPDLSTFKFDAAHTQGDKHPHDVTEQEARKFIADAYFALIRYKGNSYNYYGKEGAAFVRMDLKTIRTAFKAAEYDDNVKKLLEAYENGQRG